MVRRIALAAAVAVCVLSSANLAAASDPAPVVAVITHPVADYDKWRAAYDALLPMRKAAGMTDAQVLRGADDPNMVTLIHAFKTLEGAQSLFASPELKQAMQAAGVTAKPTIIIGLDAD